MIHETIKSLFTKGSFTQDVAIVGSGKVIVAIIGFLFIPFLARIYSPEAYGIFSIYTATVSILVILFPLGYPFSLVIIKKDTAFYNLFALSTILILIGGILTFIVIIFFYRQIISLFHLNQSSDLLYFIPLGIIINGLILVLSQLNIRRKNYKLSASLEAGGNLVIRIINLFFGLFTSGKNTGLIIGNQSGRSLVVIINFVKNFKKEKSRFIEAVSIKSIFENARNYIKYPQYILPSNLLNTFNGQLPIYLIGGAFGNSILGNFSMSTSLLSIPVQIIGNSLSAVFSKNASAIFHRDKSELPELIRKMISRLSILGILPFSFLLVFGDIFLEFLLGPQWTNAGLYTAILSPYFFFYIVFSPLYSLLQLYKKEFIIFRFSILKLFINSGAIIYGISTKDAFQTILFLSISNLLITIFEGGYTLRLSKINPYKFILKISFIFIILTLSLWGIKAWII